MVEIRPCSWQKKHLLHLILHRIINSNVPLQTSSHVGHSLHGIFLFHPFQWLLSVLLVAVHTTLFIPPSSFSIAVEHKSFLNYLCANMTSSTPFSLILIQRQHRLRLKSHLLQTLLLSLSHHHLLSYVFPFSSILKYQHPYLPLSYHPLIQ